MTCFCYPEWMKLAQPAGSKARSRRLQRKPNVLLLWAENFDAQVAVAFTTQLRRRGIRVYVTGLHQQKIRGQHGIALHTDITIHDALEIADQIDCIIVPADGVGLQTIAYEPRLASLFARVAQTRGSLVIQGLAGAGLMAADLPLHGLELYVAKPDDESVENAVEKLMASFHKTL